ncbi:MAG: site-2 protease family protein [Lawsonibacter sp.]
MAMIACILHELGHYGAIRALGGNVHFVRITAIGAEMYISKTIGYVREGICALAGPGVNLLLAVAFCGKENWIVFSGINLALGCFNLLPLSHLDGGRALRCTLALLVGPISAERIGFLFDAVMTVCVFVLGIFFAGVGRNVTLLFVSLWVMAVFAKRKSGEIGLVRWGGNE